MLSEGEYFAKFQKCATCEYCEDLSEEGYRKCTHPSEKYIDPVKASCPHYLHDSYYDSKTNYRGEYTGSDQEGYNRYMRSSGSSYSYSSSRSTSTSSSSGGCYVATAVYGSYDCPEVWTLRRYRDNTLAQTFCGRAFIRTYYAISPTFVKLFGKYKWFNRLLKAPLDRMVARLNAKGVESTPYQDKY